MEFDFFSFIARLNPEKGVTMAKVGRRKTEVKGSLLSSVERTLSLIENLSLCRSAGITQLSEAMKVGKSTIYRMLVTLEEKEFVTQDPDTGKYCLGAKIFLLARKSFSNGFPTKRIISCLKDLSIRTGENASFSVLNATRDEVVVLAEELPASPVIARPMLFGRMPLSRSPLGVLYVSLLAKNGTRKEMADAVERIVGRDLAGGISLRRNVRQCKKDGYAVCQDSEDGISSIGVKILDPAERFIGGLVLSGPSLRYTKDNISKWGKLLLEEAEKIKIGFE